MCKYLRMLASFLLLFNAQASVALAEVSPVFRQCENEIREAHKNDVISYAEQQNLLTTVHELQARDERFFAEHSHPILNGASQRTFSHDPSVMKEMQAINAKLMFLANSQSKRLNTASVPPKPWPPRDAAGNILKGPKTFGTREEIGWPLYGWSNQDRMNYEIQK